MLSRKSGHHYRCTCGELHATAIGATLCCPPIQDAPIQDAPEEDGPEIVRGSD